MNVETEILLINKDIKDIYKKIDEVEEANKEMKNDFKSEIKDLKKANTKAMYITITSLLGIIGTFIAVVSK